MAGVGIVATVFLTAMAIQFGEWAFIAMALPLGLPSIALPWALATQIERTSNDEVVVTNLFFVRRRIRRETLGKPRVRLTAQGALMHISAPRAWIPVRRAWPVYVDLYADIPDPAAFRSFFKLPRIPV